MIEINLSTSKKAKNPILEGLDLSKVNTKFVIVGIALIYLPDIIVAPMFTDIQTKAQEELDKLINERNSLNGKIAKFKDAEKQVDVLKAQEQKLQKRLEIVRSVIKTRKNPWNVMVYLSKNIPDDVWLTSIVLSDTQLNMKGRANDYKILGLFIENLKRSVFFDKTVIYNKLPSDSLPENQKNLAPFEMTATIVKFE